MAKGKKKTPYQSNSFQNMVEERANQKAVELLNNVVEQKISIAMAQVSQRLLSNVVEMLYRIQYLEEKLSVNKEEKETAILNYQDEAWGLQQVNRPAEKGDFLRVTYSFTFDGKEVVKERHGTIDNLLKDQYSPNDLPKGLHEALLGKTPGEAIEYAEDILTGEEGKTLSGVYKITLDRISEKKNKLQEKTNESTTESVTKQATSEDSGQAASTEETTTPTE